MDIVLIFATIAAIIGIGFLSEIVFKKTNVPDVIFLIAIGIILGPVLHWVSPSDLTGATIFTTFTLIFLLFEGAMNINFHELWDSLSNTTRLSITGFLLTASIVSVTAFIFNFSILTSLLLGMILGGTAASVVIPLVANIKMDDKTRIVLTLESALTDVLCIVGALTVMDIIKNGAVAPKIIFNSLFLSFGVATIAGAALGLAWILLLHQFENLTHAYMMTIAAVVGTYAFVEGLLNANGVIAVLLFGLVLGNSHQLLRKIKNIEERKVDLVAKTDIPVVRDILSESARTFYSEISFFVKVFFFVYIGVLMDFSKPHVFFFAGVLTLAIFLIRPFAVRMVYGRQIHQHERVIMEIMAPKGLAAVVLMQLAVQESVRGANNLVLPVLTTVLLTILFTALLIFLVEHHFFRGFWTPLNKKGEENI